MSEPLNPLTFSFFSSCRLQTKESGWNRFCEEALRFNPHCYTVKNNGHIKDRETALTCFQLISRVVILIFAALLILPIALMLATKSSHRKQVALKWINANANVRAEADKKAREIIANAHAEAAKQRAESDATAKAEAEKSKAEAEARARNVIAEAEKSKTEAEGQAKEMVAKAQAEALVFTSGAVSALHKTVRATAHFDAWFKAPWRVVKTSSEGVVPLSWSLERENGWSPSPIAQPSKGVVEVLLKDDSRLKLCRNIVKDAALNASLRFKGALAAPFFRKPGKEADSKREAAEQLPSPSTHSTASLDDEVGPATVQSSDMIDLKEYPANAVRLYCHLISGERGLDDVTIPDLIELYLVADQLADEKIQRIVLECIAALKATDPRFEPWLIITYIQNVQNGYPLQFLPPLIARPALYASHRFSESDRRTLFTTLTSKREELTAAKQQDYWIDYLVKLCHLDGIGCEKDSKIANEIEIELVSQGERLLKEDDGSPWDNFLIGGLSRETTTGNQLLQRAADQGIIGARYALAEKSTDKAAFLRTAHEAADQGYLDALLHLGWAYANGDGLSDEYEKAIHFFRLAAAKGTAWGHYGIAMIQSSVPDRNRNVLLIKQSHEKAHELEPKTTMFLCSLGTYWALLNPLEDYRKSFQYCSQAAELGDPKGNLWIAMHFAEGWGRDQDLGQARHHYQIALEAGIITREKLDIEDRISRLIYKNRIQRGLSPY